MSPRRSLGLFNSKFTFSLSFFKVNEISKGWVLKIFPLGPLPIQDCLFALLRKPGNSQEVFPSAVIFSVKSSTGQSDSKIFRSIDLEHRLPKRFQLAFLKLYRGWVLLSSACDFRNIGKWSLPQWSSWTDH